MLRPVEGRRILAMNKPDPIDYSHEVKLVASKPMRYAFMVAASFFLLIGFIGVFTPVLPTTPFVLLAAFCYARSSVRFYNWLMNHRWFGPSLRDWVKTRGIRPRAKILSVSLLAVSMIPTIVFIIPLMIAKVIM